VRAGSEPIVAAVAVTVALGLGLPAAASAQPSASAAATLQFDKGRALLKEKKYAEACAAFEHSQKLDPQIGTLYNLGVCYAQLGKTASAWAAYREVGERDANAKRRQDATRRARELERRLPKLLLTIAAAPPGLTVTMNGVDVTALVGTDSPVDPAEYKLRATAPGYAAWETVATIAGGRRTTTIAIELKRPAAKDPIRPSPPAADPEPPGGDAGGDAREIDPPRRTPGRSAAQRRRTFALVAGLGGAASLATGLVLGNLARGKWDDAKALCGDDRVCDDPATLAQGNALVDQARTRATLSTGFVIGGVALLGVGAALWLTAPSGKGAAETALHLAPQLGPGHAVLTLGGRFR